MTREPSPPADTELEWSRWDTRYQRVAQALIATFVLSAMFCLYLFITKEIPVLYVTEPWKDDPYDALRSFDFVALPVLAVLGTWRFLLSTTSTTVPIRRIIDLIRTCYLLIGLSLFTIASEWLSTVRAAKRARRPVQAAVDWMDEVAAAWIRRYPLTFLAAVSAFLALLSNAVQIVSEGYDPVFAIYFLTVSASSHYAFFAIANRYMNLIATPPLVQHPLRLIGVATAASIPLTEAFRQNLSWMIGLHSDLTTPTQLYTLTALVAAATATLTLAVCLVIKRAMPDNAE